MWKAFKAMMSHAAPYHFESESTWLLHSFTTTDAQHRSIGDNVLHTELPLPMPKRKRRSTNSEGPSVGSPLPHVRTGQDTGSRAPLSHENHSNLRRRETDTSRNTPSKETSETNENGVSLPSDLGDGDAGTSSRGTTSTGSSTQAQTTAPSNDASGAEQSPSIAPTTHSPSPPSGLPAESSVTNGAPPSITSTRASATVSPTSPSQVPPLSPSTTKPGKTAESTDNSSKTSSTEIEVSATTGGLSSQTSSRTSPTQEPATTSTRVSDATSSTSTTASVSTSSIPISSPTTTSSSTRTSSSTTTWSTRMSTSSSLSGQDSSTRTTSNSSKTSAISTSTSTRSTTSSISTTSSRTLTATPSTSTTSSSSSSSSSSSLTRALSISSIEALPSEPTTSRNSSSSISPAPLTSSVPVNLPTITTTVVVYTTSAGTHTTTTVEPGALRTDTSTSSAFSQNTGAIVGVSVSAFVALLSMLFLIFFVCRGYRRRNRDDPHGYIDGILNLARETSWRRPVDGDDGDSFTEKAHSRAMHSGNQELSSDGMHDALEKGSQGDHFSSQGHGSAESTTATMVPMTVVFGGQSYQAGVGGDQSPRRLSMNGLSPGFLTRTPTRTSSEAWRVPAGSVPPPNFVPARSAVSLAIATSQSYSSSSDEEPPRHTMKRKSLSGPRPMLPKSKSKAKTKSVRRHSSTPPSAFTGMRVTDPFDVEQQAPSADHSDKLSVKAFISRLRNGRRTSTHSNATIRASDRVSDESNVPPLFSPSLLNPPVPISPTHPLLTFPRGVTGNGYTAGGPTDMAAIASPVALWPPATLPDIMPSPAPTDNSSMIEFLLHPRLALGLAGSEQESTASLRDNEDYSRPINGLINNRFRSTTTFDTHDTADSDQGGESVPV